MEKLTNSVDWYNVVSSIQGRNQHLSFIDKEELNIMLENIHATYIKELSQAEIVARFHRSATFTQPILTKINTELERIDQLLFLATLSK